VHICPLSQRERVRERGKRYVIVPTLCVTSVR